MHTYAKDAAAWIREQNPSLHLGWGYLMHWSSIVWQCLFQWHSARGAKHSKLSLTEMALALSHSMQSTSHAKAVPMPMIMTAWHSEECVTILRRKSISLFWNAESNVVKMAMRSGCHWIQGSSLQLVVAATEDPLHNTASNTDLGRIGR